jgi:2-oxoglutarate dehydrogenase E2 component (dihydrolipoamide succinyltransferase)
MIIEIKIPSPGESITEVEIASWLVSDGDYVERDQEIAEVESDKATLPLLAEESGTIKILAETGMPIQVGAIACSIDTEGKAPPAGTGKEEPDRPAKTAEAEAGDRKEKAAAAAKAKEAEPEKTAKKTSSGTAPGREQETAIKEEEAAGPDNGIKGKQPKKESDLPAGYERVKLSPLAKRLMEDEGFSIDDIINGLQRITKEDVAAVAGMTGGGRPDPRQQLTGSRDAERQRMSMLRRNLSKRLVAVKNETAMLTTFNEADMSSIISIRKQYQQAFTEKHGVKLGFMSFFVKAVTEALKIYPRVNSYIDGEEVVTPRYYDTGIAVQTDKGLMVPVIRNTEILSLAEIEKKIIELADKARRNRISMDDLTGGTFSITNGGIFGSLLSTPILNPPQSGILGMHKIVERPVAVSGKVEIRPMMYIALSYDHRIIDGRDSVGFLVKVKELLENPVSMLSGGRDPVGLLLDI